MLPGDVAVRGEDDGRREVRGGLGVEAVLLAPEPERGMVACQRVTIYLRGFRLPRAISVSSASSRGIQKVLKRSSHLSMSRKGAGLTE